MKPQGLVTWAGNKYIEKRCGNVFAFVEGLVILAGQVCTSTNMKNLSLCLGGYAHSHYRGSVFLKAQDLITEFCRTTQGDGDEPIWLDSLRSINSNWKQTVQNPAFGKISELLGMFVAMGILSTSYVDFEIAGIRLFAKNVHSQHLTATNLCDAVLSTVVFFAEGGYYAIKTKSLKPLLFGNREIYQFDEEYVHLSSLFSAAVAGNLIKLDTSSELFEKRVDRFVTKGNELVMILPGGFEKKIIMDRLITIKKEFSEYNQKRLEGGSRDAPLMMSVYGKSGVGKSTFVDFMVPFLLKANNFAHTDDFITTLDPNSKHETNWRSYMTAMKLDDWNNSRADRTTVNPAQKIIDYCNNVRRCAEMADLERKGKVVIEPKIISITTNTRDLGARDFSNEPASIVRRPKLHVELSVKPEFRKAGSAELDTARVEEYYGTSDTVIHDIWNVTVSYVVIKPGKDTKADKAPRTTVHGKWRSSSPLVDVPVDFEEEEEENEEECDNKFHVPDDYVWVPYHDEYGSMENVEMNRFLPFLVAESKKHFSGQSFVTKCTKDVGKRLDLCDTCKLPPEYCQCFEDAQDEHSAEQSEQDSSEYDSNVSESEQDSNESEVVYYNSGRSIDSDPNETKWGEPSRWDQDGSSISSHEFCQECNGPRSHAGLCDCHESSYLCLNCNTPANECECGSPNLSWKTLFPTRDANPPRLCLRCRHPAIDCECSVPLDVVRTCRRCETPIIDGVCECNMTPDIESVPPSVVEFTQQGLTVHTSFLMKLTAYLQTQIMNFSWQSLFSMQEKWAKLEQDIFGGCIKWLANTYPVIGMCEEITIGRCYDLMKEADRKPWLQWTSYVPDTLINQPVFRKYAIRSRREAVNQLIICNVMLRIGLLCIALAIPMCYFLYTSQSIAFAIFGFWWTYVSVYQRKEVEKEVIRHIQQSRAAMPTFVKTVRENYYDYTINAFVLLSALYSSYKLFERVRAYLPDFQNQSGITDPEEEDVEARDLKGEDKFWEPKYKVSDFDTLPRSKWTNQEELGNVIKSNLLHVSFQAEDGYTIRRCDGLMVRSNYLLVPAHMITEHVGQLYCVRKPHDGVCRNSSFTTKIDMSVIVRVKGQDLVIIYIPNSGDFTDIASAFPPEAYKVDLPFKMAWRGPDGAISEYRGLAKPEAIALGNLIYRGCQYTLNEPTFDGLCMAVAMGSTRFPHIIGLHLGGVTGYRTGCAGTPLQGEILASLRTLQDVHPTHFKSVAMGDFPTEIYGVPTFQGADLKRASPLARIQDTNCRVYGRCPGDVHSKSTVRTLPMSSTVEEVFGVPNSWGPPKMKGLDGKSSWFPWQTNLESSLKPSIGVNPTLLKRSYDDYLGTLIKILDRKSFWKKQITPLTKVQVINGIERKRFVDRMAAQTSVGFPLSGAKSKFLTEIEHPDYEYATELDSMFWEEAARMEECYKQDRRAYAIFKASLKDEPTKVSKDKVRVFQAAPMALQLSIRKYFLPICRFLSCNPLDSECAVGINPHSPDWDELHRHISSKGENCMAIDYKKYDTRMPCQVVYAAFAIYIDLAEYTGNYTEDDLAVMRGVATEVANSMIAYNGELLCHVGTNPSGQNLTVYINSIVNSLLHRCGFFHMYPDTTSSFTDAVALTTYGDDAKGTVDARFSDFNMITFRDFLASCDIQITMADKEAEFVKYGSVIDSDFLKRTSVYHPDLQLYLAALDVESIYKPMHTGLKSAVPDEIIMADALDNGMREMLYHGKAAFEDFSSKALVVAREQKIDHLMKLGGKSYERMLYDWACDHGVDHRLPTSGVYAEVAACKIKDSTELPITDFLPTVPLQEGETL